MTEREFKKLYNLYFRPLCLYALHYVSDASVSEDIVQDSFVVFWEKYVVIDNDMNGAAAKSVLFVIVRNKCTDWLRKVSPDRLLPEDADGLITDADAQERSFDEAALWSIIGRLPEKRRKILIMNKRDGLSYKEIAEELRVSVLTVRNHLALAMKAIEKSEACHSGDPDVRNLLCYSFHISDMLICVSKNSVPACCLGGHSPEGF